jgi:predicted amidohydrolase YtcJ
MSRHFFSILLIVLISSRSKKHTADLIIRNAVIHTVDSSFSTVSALAIKDGKILATGSDQSILDAYTSDKIEDAAGKFIYPGFIDAHCHFFQYGLGLQTADLVGTRSWAAILDSLRAYSSRHPEGWIIGRGWDQNDWAVKEFPTNAELNKLFPGRPVILTRIDGHAAIVNKKALELAEIKAGEKIIGGEIETRNGELTGLLVDNAVDLVYAKLPTPDASQMKAALLDAQANCFAMGLTTVDDCGLNYKEVEFIDSIQQTADLKMRVYAMLSDGRMNYDFLFARGKIKTERLNVRAFKVYADGALGSRGACLLKPYSDKPGYFGFLLSKQEHFDSVAAILAEKNFQMCTHAIGDSGNRMILDVYAKYLKGSNDHRWRIEHSQVVHPEDIQKFRDYNIIPSVQPTHATSDMYWTGKRLGKEREKTAYAYNDLLQQNGWIALGTDFPVEDISPFKTFYAAVARMDAQGYPKNGYQSNNALSREAALRGMTIWAAKSNFEETEKGSLEKGKLADFIIVDQDLLSVPVPKILSTHVLSTFVNGERVYSK